MAYLPRWKVLLPLLTDLTGLLLRRGDDELGASADLRRELRRTAFDLEVARRAPS